MAIEIREIVVRANITKNLASGKHDFVTKAEFARFQNKLLARIMSNVRDLIEEHRSIR
jgi:Family of unknown function (DUF5908)